MKMPGRSKKLLNITKNHKQHYNDKLSVDNIVYVIFVLVSAVKVLLIYTYHSTDFEVHRNWLAITYSLPISEWYVNAKSEWTLDYPPFFAWFECLLSQFAKFVDPRMLDVDNLNYASPNTVKFQRGTVILSDLLLLYGVREVGHVFCKRSENFISLAFLALCNVGLLIVDHIHFQYNGFLLGILLLSIAQVSKSSQGQVLLGAIYFAVLLNFKHIYLYVAPAFIVWLLKCYCLKSQNFFTRLLQLGVTVLTIFMLSFGPFIHQLPQVLSRLFPFKRGLVHAYWAANIWALYIGLDKILSVIWKRLGWLSVTKTATMTGGLVQEDILAVLPTPTPAVTFVATIVIILPIVMILFTKKQENCRPRDFVRCLILCALSSFIFGWHVHEKAILTAIIPLCILATNRPLDARVFLILSSTGHTAILPLLFPENLILLKILLVWIYEVAAAHCLRRLFNQPILKLHEWLYILTLPIVTLYETIFHKLIFNDHLPFLPLAATSIYCAVGVIYSWLLYCYVYCYDNNDLTNEKNESLENFNNVKKAK